MQGLSISLEIDNREHVTSYLAMLMKYDSASVCLFDSSTAAKCQTSKLETNQNCHSCDQILLSFNLASVAEILGFHKKFFILQNWISTYTYHKIANDSKTIVTRRGGEVVWQFGTMLPYIRIFLQKAFYLHHSLLSKLSLYQFFPLAEGNTIESDCFLSCTLQKMWNLEWVTTSLW